MGATAIARPVPHLRILPLGTLSDERLAQLASVGHSDAFETLYERYRDALARYCRSIVRDPDDAKDALQSTMVSVLRAIQTRVPSGPVRPWMYRIAHNESISLIRRRRPHEELSLETPDRADTERASLARGRLDELLVDLRSLPERQRGALVMRELGGLEYGEIANALQMSPVSARKAVFEARVALHDLATGRDASCDEIKLRISNGDGRVLRSRSIRGHLTACASCSSFEQGLRDRRGAFGLVPVLPVVSLGALLGFALPGGGGGSTSGLALGGGTAAAGSALGGGSMVAVKGIAIGGAIAVAGAGVFVGSGIVSHVARHHRAPVAHSARPAPVRVAAGPVAHAARPVRLAVARTFHAPRLSAIVVAQANASTTARHVPVASKPNVQGPSVALPVAATTPTAAAPSTSPAAEAPTTPPASAPPTATTPATSPTPTGPSPTTSQVSATATPTTFASLVNTIIQQALQTARADVTAAEAQAAQAVAQAGSAPGTPTFQNILTAILNSQHG